MAAELSSCCAWFFNPVLFSHPYGSKRDLPLKQASLPLSAPQTQKILSTVPCPFVVFSVLWLSRTERNSNPLLAHSPGKTGPAAHHWGTVAAANQSDGFLPTPKLVRGDSSLSEHFPLIKFHSVPQNIESGLRQFTGKRLGRHCPSASRLLPIKPAPASRIVPLRIIGRLYIRPAQVLVAVLPVVFSLLLSIRFFHTIHKPAIRCIVACSPESFYRPAL